ncbi:hypothetical protein AGMMS4952_18860 [Spirochaetia bacterium]|nr:hypothetical protein AGMMS4952_18860 [Spirochaetia bacterium]
MSILGELGSLGALAVFSGLALNLLLQFGIGISEIVEPSDSRETQWASLFSPHWIILFVSSFALWLFFTYVLIPPAFGFLESFLYFPAALLVSMVLELVFAYFFPGGRVTPAAFESLVHRKTNRGSFKPGKLAGHISLNAAGLPRYSGNGLAPAALFLTLRLAISPVDALVLCLGFSLGCLVAALILREIDKRSSLETAPGVLRGAPLTIISMGLLSLIFSAVSAIFFRVLGVF